MAKLSEFEEAIASVIDRTLDDLDGFDGVVDGVIMITITDDDRLCVHGKGDTARIARAIERAAPLAAKAANDLAKGKPN